LTHFYGVPSNPRRAIVEYEKALAINPRHEATLLNMAQALIKTGEIEKAQQTLQEAQNINPNNPTLSDLQAQLALTRGQGGEDITR
jgi:predicted Zn-dependent protease